MCRDLRDDASISNRFGVLALMRMSRNLESLEAPEAALICWQLVHIHSQTKRVAAAAATCARAPAAAAGELIGLAWR